MAKKIVIGIVLVVGIIICFWGIDSIASNIVKSTPQNDISMYGTNVEETDTEAVQELLSFLIFCVFIIFIGGIGCIIGAVVAFTRRVEPYKAYNKFIVENEIAQMLQQVDLFDGIEFEKFVANILYKNGYKDIEVTRGSGDYGADVIAQKDNIRYAFQCKRFNSTIGPKPIGEILRGMQKYNCNKGVVITNSYFSKQVLVSF